MKALQQLPLYMQLAGVLEQTSWTELHYQTKQMLRRCVCLLVATDFSSYIHSFIHSRICSHPCNCKLLNGTNTYGGAVWRISMLR